MPAAFTSVCRYATGSACQIGRAARSGAPIAGAARTIVNSATQTAAAEFAIAAPRRPLSGSPRIASAATDTDSAANSSACPGIATAPTRVADTTSASVASPAATSLAGLRRHT